MRHLAWVVACLLVACGGAVDDGDPQDTLTETDDTVTESDAPPAPVTLVVREGYEIDPLGTVPAMEGRFVILTVRLTNNTGGRLLTAAPTFLLRTDTGLEYFGSPVATEFTSEPCPAEAQLGDGAAIRCSLAFDIPDAQTPKTLIYGWTTDAGLLEVKADVDTTPCTRCGSVCTDVATDDAHCGTCFNALPEDASCDAGAPVCTNSAKTWCTDRCVNTSISAEHCGTCNTPVGNREVCQGGTPVCSILYPTRCDGTCVNTNTNDNHCGSCNTPAPNNTTCVGGEPSCQNANRPTLCTDECVDLDENPDHCSTCNMACGTDEECFDGLCGETIRVNQRVACDDVCGDIGYTCYDAWARYNGFGLWDWFEVPCYTEPEVTQYVGMGFDGIFQVLDCNCLAP